MNEGTLFPMRNEAIVTDSVVAEFAVAVLRDPNNRTQHATRIFAGDWGKAAQLLQYAETPAFTAVLQQVRMNMSKLDQTYNKEDFVLIVQDKMSTFEGKLWLETAQFYAKLQGFVSEESAVTINNNVIQVPANQTANVWEGNAVNHQSALQAEARVINE